MGFFGTFKYFNYASKMLRKLVSDIEADLVIAFNDREVILCWYALRHMKDVKVLFSQRNSHTSKVWRTNILLKYIYSHSDATVFQLDAVKKFYGNKKCYYVIANPIKIRDYSITLDRKNIILSAGRLTEQKRFDLLIEAFALFQQYHNDYVLQIYGKGEERDKLFRLIEELGIVGKVEIKEPIPNVIENNANVSVFVLTSDFEGIPNVVLEAMNNCIPCVVTDCLPGGGQLLTNNGKCGMLVDRGNIQQIANAIKLCVEDGDYANTMVKLAHDYIERFDEPIIFGEWCKIIKGLLED